MDLLDDFVGSSILKVPSTIGVIVIVPRWEIVTAEGCSCCCDHHSRINLTWGYFEIILTKEAQIVRSNDLLIVQVGPPYPTGHWQVSGAMQIPPLEQAGEQSTVAQSAPENPEWQMQEPSSRQKPRPWQLLEHETVGV